MFNGLPVGIGTGVAEVRIRLIVKQVVLNHGGLLRIEHRPRRPAWNVGLRAAPDRRIAVRSFRCDGWRSEHGHRAFSGSGERYLSGISVHARNGCAVTVKATPHAGPRMAKLASSEPRPRKNLAHDERSPTLSHRRSSREPQLWRGGSKRTASSSTGVTHRLASTVNLQALGGTRPGLTA